MNLRPFVLRPDRVREAIPIRFAKASEDYGVQHEAFTTDRSLRGMGIQTAVPLIPGEIIRVSLEGNTRDPIPARVVWAQGVEFSTGSVAGLQFPILMAA